MFRVLERTAWAVALIALAAWAAAWISGTVGARLAVSEVLEAQAASDADIDGPPDFMLWSPARVQAWRAARTATAPLPVGVLQIQRVHVKAPILPGTDDSTLNRGVGHIEGTAVPGSAGNSGIAGHRDSFFRGLKDIGAGDAIEVITTAAVVTYRVERTWIVRPEDVWVLDPTPSPSLTLVTCYPFYFIGSAPERFIVRAVRLTTRPRERTER